MKWTLEQFLVAIRERIDESEDKEFIRDAELIRYLNIAILDLTEALSLRGIKKIAAPNTDEIDLDTIFVEEDRFARLDKVFVNEELKTLTTVEQSKIDNLPYQYGNLVIFPEPVGQEMELYYIKSPKTLVNMQDTTDIQERFQHIPIDLCIALCKEKDEEFGMAQQARAHYEENKFMMQRAREGIETQNDYKTVTINNYWE